MPTFKFVKTADSSELDYSTRFVAKEEQITVTVNKALWRADGSRLNIEQLAALGLQLKFIPDQTQERLDFEHIATLYQYVPVFAERVQEWKAMYDILGIAYDARTEDIEAAELSHFTDAQERSDFHDRFMGKRVDVMVNYQAAERAYVGVIDEEYDPVDDYNTWTDLPTLIRWLPGNYEAADVPVRKEEEIVASDERETEINAELIAESAFTEEPETPSEEEPLEETPEGEPTQDDQPTPDEEPTTPTE